MLSRKGQKPTEFVLCYFSQLFSNRRRVRLFLMDVEEEDEEDEEEEESGESARVICLLISKSVAVLLEKINGLVYFFSLFNKF